MSIYSTIFDTKSFPFQISTFRFLLSIALIPSRHSLHSLATVAAAAAATDKEKQDERSQTDTQTKAWTVIEHTPTQPPTLTLHAWQACLLSIEQISIHVLNFFKVNELGSYLVFT